MKRIHLFLIMIFNILFFIISTSPVSAQCPDIPEKSSCITCHQTSSIPPERATFEWHNTHFQKDCCTRCHGGNCIAEEEDTAHEGLIVQPLDDIYTSCRGCHPTDYVVLANQLAASIGVIPGSLTTPTPVPTSPSAGRAMFIATPVVPVQSGVPISVPLVLGGSLIIWFGIIALLARRLQANNTSPSGE